MASLKILIFIGLCGIVASVDEEKLLEPCAVEDIECLNTQNEVFLKKTSAGIPKYNIKPIDPMPVPDLVVPISDDLKFKLRNIQITGFLNEKITDFKLDRAGKFMTLDAKEKVNIAGEVTADYLKLGKSLTGPYSISAGALLSIRLEYDLKKDDKGVQYMTIGKDTMTCQASDVKITLDPKLVQAVKDDAEINELEAKYAEKKTEVSNKVTCDVILAAYETVMENFRQFAKVLPVTAYFSNV